MNGKAMKIKISDCLRWLTDDYDETKREEMAESSLIQSMLSDLFEFMETTDNSIDLLDRETWGSYSLSCAEDMIWNTIASRAAHQQRVENLVQMAGHLGKMHVEEARRSVTLTRGQCNSFEKKTSCVSSKLFKTSDQRHNSDDAWRGK